MTRCQGKSASAFQDDRLTFWCMCSPFTAVLQVQYHSAFYWRSKNSTVVVVDHNQPIQAEHQSCRCNTWRKSKVQSVQNVYEHVATKEVACIIGLFRHSMSITQSIVWLPKRQTHLQPASTAGGASVHMIIIQTMHGSECVIQIWRTRGWKCRTRARPECDIFNRGLSYLNVAGTTVIHLFCLMTNY